MAVHFQPDEPMPKTSLTRAGRARAAVAGRAYAIRRGLEELARTFTGSKSRWLAKGDMRENAAQLYSVRKGIFTGPSDNQAMRLWLEKMFS